MSTARAIAPAAGAESHPVHVAEAASQRETPPPRTTETPPGDDPRSATAQVHAVPSAQQRSADAAWKHSSPAGTGGGIPIPPLPGELKVVVSGASNQRVTVSFRPFPLSRRSRPFSRSELRTETRLEPVMADGADNSRLFVIAKTRPGVYTILSEPSGGGAEATVVLKIYEGTAKSVTRDLGRQRFERRMIITRVLMPEGILWGDERSFTGSIEDSEGITRFNSETGLVWRESSE